MRPAPRSVNHVRAYARGTHPFCVRARFLGLSSHAATMIVRDGATLDEKQDRRNFAGLTVDVGLDLVDMWTLWTCFGDGEGCPHTDRFSYLISFHRDN